MELNDKSKTMIHFKIEKNFENNSYINLNLTHPFFYFIYLKLLDINTLFYRIIGRLESNFAPEYLKILWKTFLFYETVRNTTWLKRNAQPYIY